MSIQGNKTRERSLQDLFVLIKQVLPDEQVLEKFSPETPVLEALRFMQEKNFSQVPVMEGRQLLGVFSYRSFAMGVMDYNKTPNIDPLKLNVEDFLEKLRFCQISDELEELLDEFELKDAVLVGTEQNVQGIVTVTDALRYFYEVASEYVILREIELAVRELLRTCLDDVGLAECIEKSVKKHYLEMNLEVPSRLEELSLSDYVSILCRGDTWEKFQRTFGSDRRVVNAKLQPIPDLRNDIFHFKRKITVEEFEKLRQVRDWLIRKINIVEARRKAVV